MDGSSIEEVDLYEVLEISRGASKTEIKKAYHKAALSSHPDKVPESDRATAEIRFKSVSQAYEILSDEDKRHLYDTHGMAAFDSSRGGAGDGPEMDINDLFAHMFGMGGGGGDPFGMGGGMPGMGGGGFANGRGPGGAAGPRRPRKGKNVEQEYEVTLEELYKGKTTKFTSTRNVVCATCKGSGGKEKAKPHKCGVCQGRGQVLTLRVIGPGLPVQETTICDTCRGAGSTYKEKDKCKKCKGRKTVEHKKVLELYIPRGSREGERIVLAGEADQLPDQEPGDIIFHLSETPHETFKRAGADLAADIHVSLAEALTGFERVVLTHLDGRGVQLRVRQPGGKVLTPGQVLKVAGEGMPLKRSDAKGDLYLTVHVDFPKDGWLKDDAAVRSVRSVLPKDDGSREVKADTVDEVECEFDADIEGFGAGSNDPRAGPEWEDDSDEEGEAQCAQQ